MFKWLLLMVGVLALLVVPFPPKEQVADAGPFCRGLRFIGRGVGRTATLPVRAVRRGGSRILRRGNSGCAGYSGASCSGAASCSGYQQEQYAPPTPSVVSQENRVASNPLVDAWRSDTAEVGDRVLIASR